MKFLKRFFSEYFFINVFIFSCISLLSLIVLNISFFDPFTQAFEDFTLTDLHYSRIKKQDQIYNGPVVLINLENKERKELAFLLQRIQEGNPKVVGMDVLFQSRKEDDDSLLREQFALHKNYVFSYFARFDEPEKNIYNNSFFTTTKNGYANVVGENREYSTIRYYYPFHKEQEAFTTSMIRAYNPELLSRLKEYKGKPLEIHYYGNLENFRYYNFEEIMDPTFDPQVLNGKIIVLGYLGTPGVNSRIDEDKLFTPLNSRLSGRSYPDMYGSVIHANILRMVLDKDYIRVIPGWLVAILTFLIVWLLLPPTCSLLFKGDLWFNTIGTLAQLTGTIVIVFLSLLCYEVLNIKFDPGLLLGCLVLLPTLLNLYEAFLKFLYYKLKLKFRSRFLSIDDYA